LWVRAKITSFLFASSASRLFASLSESAKGLSQITWMPALMKAFAAGTCTWFGVTMATASMPSARFASALAISSKEP